MNRIAVCALALTGCVGLQPTYVAADRQTFNAVAPEYRRYVDADETLDERQRARRQRTLDSWENRLEAAEEAGRE